MRHAIVAFLAMVAIPAIAFAQADCEPQPANQPEQPMPAPQEGEGRGLPMPQRADEQRPSIEESMPSWECDGRAVPEVLNGTFVPPRPGREQADPGVMASISEDMGDWKGAAQEYEAAKDWPKAAENWGRLSKDLCGMGLWKEAGKASQRRFDAEKKAALDEVRKAQEAVNALLKQLEADPDDPVLKAKLAEAQAVRDRAIEKWKAVLAAEKDEPRRLAEERKAAEAKAAEEARRAAEARKKAEEEAKKAEAERKAAEAKRRAEEQAAADRRAELERNLAKQREELRKAQEGLKAALEFVRAAQSAYNEKRDKYQRYFGIVERLQMLFMIVQAGKDVFEQLTGIDPDPTKAIDAANAALEKIKTIPPQLSDGGTPQQKGIYSSEAKEAAQLLETARHRLQGALERIKSAAEEIVRLEAELRR